MKYYIDTEFLEGTQKKTLLGIPYGNTKPTIDLISIGIIAEDGREYYAISKDFNLKEAWNRWQQRTGQGDRNNIQPKEYWIRKNVLRPIFEEWKFQGNGKILRLGLPIPLNDREFNYKNFRYYIKCIGKTNKQIAKEIKEFVGTEETIANWSEVKDKMSTQFYGYYCDYDWVRFCWLFGKMIDLPKSFPMYCIDLKQELDRKADVLLFSQRRKYGVLGETDGKIITKSYTTDEIVKAIKKDKDYPKQTNEHNALADAKWNKELHEFILKL